MGAALWPNRWVGNVYSAVLSLAAPACRERPISSRGFDLLQWDSLCGAQGVQRPILHGIPSRREMSAAPSHTLVLIPHIGP